MLFPNTQQTNFHSLFGQRTTKQHSNLQRPRQAPGWLTRRSPTAELGIWRRPEAAWFRVWLRSTEERRRPAAGSLDCLHRASARIRSRLGFPSPFYSPRVFTSALFVFEFFPTHLKVSTVLNNHCHVFHTDYPN